MNELRNNDKGKQRSKNASVVNWNCLSENYANLMDKRLGWDSKRMRFCLLSWFRFGSHAVHKSTVRTVLAVIERDAPKENRNSRPVLSRRIERQAPTKAWRIARPSRHWNRPPSVNWIRNTAFLVFTSTGQPVLLFLIEIWKRKSITRLICWSSFETLQRDEWERTEPTGARLSR